VSDASEVCGYWTGTAQLRVGFEIRGHSVTTHEQLNSGLFSRVSRGLNDVAQIFSRTKAFGLTVGFDAFCRVSVPWGQPDRKQRTINSVSAMESLRVSLHRFLVEHEQQRIIRRVN